MESIKLARERKGISQRNLASLAGISYKTLQLLESGQTDLQLSTLTKVASALGYPSTLPCQSLESIFSIPEDSISVIAARIIYEGDPSWKVWLFEFVDAFRRHRLEEYIKTPPSEDASRKIKALLASTVEALCVEMEISTPTWCSTVEALKDPWFVSDTEYLKVTALVESPVSFRKRNIFVLGNFLERR